MDSLGTLASKAYYNTLKSPASKALIKGSKPYEIIALLPTIELEELAVILNVRGRLHDLCIYPLKEGFGKYIGMGSCFARFSAWDDDAQTVRIRVDHTTNREFWMEIMLPITGIHVGDTLMTHCRYSKVVSFIARYYEESRSLYIRADSGQHPDFRLELCIDLAKLERWIAVFIRED